MTGLFARYQPLYAKQKWLAWTDASHFRLGDDHPRQKKSSQCITYTKQIFVANNRVCDFPRIDVCKRQMGESMMRMMAHPTTPSVPHHRSRFSRHSQPAYRAERTSGQRSIRGDRRRASTRRSPKSSKRKGRWANGAPARTRIVVGLAYCVPPSVWSRELSRWCHARRDDRQTLTHRSPIRCAARRLVRNAMTKARFAPVPGRSVPAFRSEPNAMTSHT
jgi:hypothetical protein